MPRKVSEGRVEVTRLVNRIISEVSLEKCETGMDCWCLRLQGIHVRVCRIHHIRAILLEELERGGGPTIEPDAAGGAA